MDKLKQIIKNTIDGTTHGIGIFWLIMIVVFFIGVVLAVVWHCVDPLFITTGTMWGIIAAFVFAVGSVVWLNN